jgi:hypothetical protein
MSQQTEATARPTGRTTGVYVYGMVPADVEPTADAQGIGDPPSSVQVVRHNDVAALVSEVRLDRPLGRPGDLRAYERLLDGTASVAPVLPVRFGAVLTDTGAVTDLLSRFEEQFRSALNELEGRAEYAVRGRYVERVLLTEVLKGSPEVQQLREQIRNLPEAASMNLRIRLGEIVNQAVEAKRNADTQRLVEELSPFADQVMVREATHEQDAGNIALLVSNDCWEEFESAVRHVAEEWADRVSLRLLGPLAPYDFVAPLEPGA